MPTTHTVLLGRPATAGTGYWGSIFLCLNGLEARSPWSSAAWLWIQARHTFVRSCYKRASAERSPTNNPFVCVCRKWHDSVTAVAVSSPPAADFPHRPRSRQRDESLVLRRTTWQSRSLDFRRVDKQSRTEPRRVG